MFLPCARASFLVLWPSHTLLAFHSHLHSFSFLSLSLFSSLALSLPTCACLSSALCPRVPSLVLRVFGPKGAPSLYTLYVTCRSAIARHVAAAHRLVWFRVSAQHTGVGDFGDNPSPVSRGGRHHHHAGSIWCDDGATLQCSFRGRGEATLRNRVPRACFGHSNAHADQQQHLGRTHCCQLHSTIVGAWSFAVDSQQWRPSPRRVLS